MVIFGEFFGYIQILNINGYEIIKTLQLKNKYTRIRDIIQTKNGANEYAIATTEGLYFISFGSRNEVIENQKEFYFKG